MALKLERTTHSQMQYSTPFPASRYLLDARPNIARVEHVYSRISGLNPTELNTLVQVTAEFCGNSPLAAENLTYFSEFLIASLNSGLAKPTPENLKALGTKFLEICKLMEEKGFTDGNLLEALVGSAKAGLFHKEEDLVAVHSYVSGLSREEFLSKFSSPVGYTKPSNSFVFYIDESPGLGIIGSCEIRPLLPGIEISLRRMNQFLEPGFRIGVVNIELHPTNCESVSVFSGGYKPLGRLHEIEISLPVLTDRPYNGIIEMIALHEAAHAFEDQIRTCRPDEWEVFVSVFDQIKSNNRLLSLFKESEYSGAEPNMGHPGLNQMELFASCTAILVFWPSEFLQRISELNSHEIELVNNVVNFVTGQYIKQNAHVASELFNSEIRFIDLLAKIR